MRHHHNMCFLVVAACAMSMGCATANDATDSTGNSTGFADEPTSTVHQGASQLPELANAQMLRRPFVDPLSKWRFDTPPNLKVLATRFDPNTPPIKFKEQFDVSDGDKMLAQVSVWNNVQGLELSQWIDTNTAYLRKTGATEHVNPAGVRNGKPVYVYQYAASCAGPATMIAVFADGLNVVSVMTPDGDDPQSRSAFDMVLESFERVVEKEVEK